MGVLLDSTFLIAHERARLGVRDVLRAVKMERINQEIALSVITVMELMHGVQRADTPERAARSRLFLDEALVAIEIQPVTETIALRAGRMDGLLTAQGNRIATADLLIAATALELGYTIVTGNMRHFERVPGLQLVKL